MDTATATEQYTIRHLLPSDKLEANVWPSLTDRLDPDWVWIVADEHDQPMTVLIACPMHGIVMIMRLWASPYAPRHTMRRLLRTAGHEWRERGFRAGMVLLNPNNPKEAHLCRLALKLRGIETPLIGNAYVGGLDGL